MSESNAQCAIVNASLRNNSTNCLESPIVSRNALLSLVALVRRLHEHGDASNSGGLDDCPKGSAGADNHVDRTAAKTPYHGESSREIAK